MIDGVSLRDLTPNCDDRGYLMEAWKDSGGWRALQSNISLSYPGVIRAFHWHTKQDDYWVVPKGMLRAVLYDRRPDSPTYKDTQVVMLGEHRPLGLFIPRGVAHGFQVIGPDAALLVYWVNQHYNATFPDEERIPYDDPEIGFEWSIKAR